MAGTMRRGTRHAVAAPRATLRESLRAPDAFVAIVELVPWRGALGDERGAPALEAARDLAGDPRVGAVSITDNAGGHARLGPAPIAEEFVARGQEVIVHVACRDRSRTALQSLGWELASRGLSNVLALSGDYPVEGFGGLSKPVFDIDSVALLRMYADASAELAPTGFAGFFLGAAVNNHKRHEAEVIPQYLKLAMKIRNGAGFIISQVGYDARKQDELLRYMRLHGLDVPVVANAYILGRGVARAFHDGRIPGCVVTDELMAVVERQAASPDRGRGFFLEFAAKQVAVARGLGYRGVYLSGHRDAGEVRWILDTAAGFGRDDWRTFAREIRFSSPGEFHYFEEDLATGLCSDPVNRRYLRSKTPAALARSRARGSIPYRVNRIAHARVFAPGTPGFRRAGRIYAAAERHRFGHALHVLEHAGKMPLFDCRDCGDCSLPDIAYLCPESQCAKNQRNGPCGGTHDGLCEVGEKACIWARAYDRLKPYGEEASMLDRPPVIQDNALRGTSAWANTFLGRDHFARIEPDPAPSGVSGDGHG